MEFDFSIVVGKTIKTIKVNKENDNLEISFSEGGSIRIWDDGSCCEKRYLVGDDDLSFFVGASFMGAETREAAAIPTDYGDHQVQFLIVHTSKGDATFSNHNEHNGYYGGFGLTWRFDK